MCKLKCLTKNQHSSNAGFTIIELAIVIVVLAIIAAIVIPQFRSVDTQARQASADSIADGLTAAAASNYTLSKAGNSKAVTVTNCQNISSALPPSQPLPTGYTIVSTALSSGVEGTCTLIGPGGVTASFIGIGT